MSCTISSNRANIARIASLGIMVVLAVQILAGCNYARMRDDEAVQAYNAEFPTMPKKTVPVEGGIWVERGSNPTEFVNVLPETRETVAFGAERYGFYCAQCHGVRADGNGTVGQSFAPLPTNFRNPQVQDQDDGMIFYKIRFGYNRHPPLYSTLTEKETWALVRYIRSLADRT
ncbi:MAG: cytochrome c [Syntrophobacteraceae bacterium]